MKFCEICKNMLYITLEEEKDKKESLKYYCRNCGYDEVCETSVCISSSRDIVKSANSYRNVINKYTKFDPTLPRVNNIPCPNEDCQTNKADAKERADREVIYLRYDAKNMKYIYLCFLCETSWIIDDNKHSV
jgi:DNA-directed RNA polymerase subunit M/transcription elongation factor TFIIS